MRNALLSVTLLSLPAFSAAQTPPFEILQRGDREQVFLDQPGDGNVWARGNTYKARFGSDGVEYIPFLGSRAPRNFPLWIRLEAVSIGSVTVPFDKAVAPTVEGTRVVYDRGAVLETWDLRLNEVEQRFVLHEAIGAGDLVVRLAVETELFHSGESGGLLFEAPGHGGVRYGDALAFDTRGTSIERPVEFVGGEIEVRLPASFLAAAEFPLTVDPVVSTFAVDAAVGVDQVNADVAYDVTSNLWCVSFEEVFSASDHDVIAQKRSPSGALLGEYYPDITTNDSRNPAIANSNSADQFMMVLEHQPSAGGDINIRGRVLWAAAGLGLAVDITTDSGDEVTPDIGGDPSLLGTNYLVAWTDLPTFLGDSDIYARRVSTALALGPILTIDSASQSDMLPAVTKSCGASGYWMVVWEKGFTLPPDNDIYRAVVSRGGAVVAASAPVDGGSLPQDYKPDVAGDGDEFLAVWSRYFATPFPGDDDIMGARITRSGLTFTNVSGSLSLTALETGSILYYDQGDPTVDFDGCRFTYAYQERSSFTATNHNIYAATVIPSGASLVWHEGHVAVATTIDPEQRIKLASRAGAGGAAVQYFLAWDREETPGNHDIYGAIFNGTTPAGGVTFVPTGCGSPEPIYLTTGLPALGAPFGFQFYPTPGAVPVLAIGLPPLFLPFPLCPTQGGCYLGVGTILALIPSASFSAPVPCNAGLIGGTLAIQGFGLGGAGGCSPPVAVATFSATDTVQVTIQ